MDCDLLSYIPVAIIRTIRAMPHICSDFYSSVFNRCSQHSSCSTGHGVSRPRWIERSICFSGTPFSIHRLITKSQSLIICAAALKMQVNYCFISSLHLVFVIVRNTSCLPQTFSTLIFIYRKIF